MKQQIEIGIMKGESLQKDFEDVISVLHQKFRFGDKKNFKKELLESMVYKLEVGEQYNIDNIGDNFFKLIAKYSIIKDYKEIIKGMGREIERINEKNG
jgi:hypothetical protein